MAKKQKREPLWKGPEKDGVTQSLLSRFLVCRERFRVLVVEGLRPADDFNHRLEFGSMWHICEENSEGNWESELREYCQRLCATYPLRQSEVVKWYEVCKRQFPIYRAYWRAHRQNEKATPIYEEETFGETYEVPSGGKVLLRGKWDGVFQVGRKVMLQENKTKGDIDEQSVQNQLRFDLQTMFYLVALKLRMNRDKSLQRTVGKGAKIAGVRYNVVRRPLSGGKGSIRPYKATKTKPAETDQQYYDRLAGIIREEPEYYFMRWDSVVTAADVERFERQFLSPILEQLLDWWDCVSGGEPNFGIHWRFPYGVYSPMMNGRMSEVDEYLDSGSMLGLDRVNTLFRELEDADSEKG